MKLFKLSVEALNDLLALCHVPRWVVVRHTVSQSVAEHSYRVAMIAMRIATELPFPDDDGVRPFNLLWLCLTHDADEALTGDIPSPAKRILRMQRGIIDNFLPQSRMPVYGFTIHEHKILKLADSIEAYTFIRLTGVGQHAARSAARILSVAIELGKDLGVDAFGIAQGILHETGRFRDQLPPPESTL